MTSTHTAIAPNPAPAAVEGARPAVPVVRRGVVRRGLAGRILSLLGTGLLGLCILVFVLIALGPHLFGYRTATMLTGSMEPDIKPGDVVVAFHKPTTEVAVGDVISYHIPVEDHRVETHRVVEVIHHEDGSIAVRTKGDNNSDADPWTATLQGDTVWEVRAVIPDLGSAIRTLRGPAVQHGVLWFAFGALLLLGLRIIWGRSPEDADHEQDPEQASEQTPEPDARSAS